MIDGGYLNAACGYAEGRFLESLEFLNQGWWGVGETDGSGIHEKELDNGYIGDKDFDTSLYTEPLYFHVKDVDMGWSSRDGIDIWQGYARKYTCSASEMRFESDS